MALIGMAVWDTEINGRSVLTARTLASLHATVDWTRHRLIISDNGSCPETLALYTRNDLPPGTVVIQHGVNRGTARAVNAAWLTRQPGEHALKIDNDVVIHDPGWLDTLEACLVRDPQIGIIGLKRKDVAETPHAPSTSWNHSTLTMLPHQPGERWLVVERVHHVIGTCQLYASALLDRIGYLVQDGLYGFDDALAATRCKKAGFYSCFYPHYAIDHIDPGTTPYQAWKEQYAGARMQRFFALREAFETGRLPLYCGPEDVL